MNKTVYLVAYHMLVLVIVGSYAWSRQLPEDYDLVRHLYASQLKRVPAYSFGLGKRTLDDDPLYDEGSSGDLYDLAEKRAGSMYSFGLGKRNRANYGFGLGKRLEASLNQGFMARPAYRQERRSKIYSFGLGKRQSPGSEDEFDSQHSDKRSESRRQFAFGLGKRDTESSNMNSTS